MTRCILLAVSYCMGQTLWRTQPRPYPSCFGTLANLWSSRDPKYPSAMRMCPATPTHLSLSASLLALFVTLSHLSLSASLHGIIHLLTSPETSSHLLRSCHYCHLLRSCHYCHLLQLLDRTMRAGMCSLRYWSREILTFRKFASSSTTHYCEGTDPLNSAPLLLL